MRRLHLVLLGLVLLPLAACGRVRFIVDTMPTSDELTETVVLEEGPRGSASTPKVALVDVTGTIADARRPGLVARGRNPVDEFTETLRRAGDDVNVKAVLVRINSPGGTVTASDVMYRELIDFKQRSGMPVVILMADVAASGGYYLACAGDEIIAYPTTITGSIGVIMQMVNVSDGMRRIGISADAITSGPNKALGSPFAPMPPEHRAILQEIVNEFYGNFVAIVTENRPDLATDQLERITDGRVVTGRQAEALGMVDGVGGLRDAFAAARARAGLTRARLIKYHRPMEHVGSAYAAAPVPPSTQVNLMQVNLDGAMLAGSAGFYYLWDPGAWR